MDPGPQSAIRPLGYLPRQLEFSIKLSAQFALISV